MQTPEAAHMFQILSGIVLWENKRPFHPLWQSETLGFVVTSSSPKINMIQGQAPEQSARSIP